MSIYLNENLFFWSGPREISRRGSRRSLSRAFNIKKMMQIYEKR